MRMRATLAAIAVGLAVPLTSTPVPAPADEADVVDVLVRGSRDQGYRIDVTVRHADEGWEHYADRWEVLSPDGTVLATRVLHHPRGHR